LVLLFVCVVVTVRRVGARTTSLFVLFDR